MVAVSVLDSSMASNYLDERSTMVKMWLIHQRSGEGAPSGQYEHGRISWWGWDGYVLGRCPQLLGHLGLLAMLTVMAPLRYVGRHAGPDPS